MVNLLESDPPPKNLEPKGQDGASLPTDQLTTYGDRHNLPVDVEIMVTKRDFHESSRTEEGYTDYDRS